MGRTCGLRLPTGIFERRRVRRVLTETPRATLEATEAVLGRRPSLRYGVRDKSPFRSGASDRAEGISQDTPIR